MKPMVYLLWSNEHTAWWGPRQTGYTERLEQAGRYGMDTAAKIVVEYAASGKLSRAVCLVAAPENWPHLGKDGKPL